MTWRQRIVAMLLPLLAALHAAGQGVGSDSVRSIESALRDRQYTKALELAGALLKQEPGQAQILTLEGIAYSGLGQNREALAAFNGALAKEPNSLAALEGAAQLEFNAGDDRAELLLRRIVRLRPEEPTSHAMLATIAYQRKDCKSAVEQFSKAEASIAHEPTALTEFGACLLDQERPADAVAVLQQALAAKPDDPHLRYNLGVAQVTAHQSKEAITTLQPLIEGDKPDPDALDEAAVAYEDTGDTPEAVRLLRMALIASPKELIYYMDFAALSLKHSSWKVGLDVVNVGLKELPDAASLYVARGILNVQQSNFSAAQSDFETASRLDPAQTSGAIAAGMAQLQQNNPVEALATVEAELKNHPDDAFLLYLKSSALVQSGPAPGTPRFVEALDAANKANHAKPLFLPPHDLLATLYLESGDFIKAEEQCRFILDQNPSDEKAVYHLIQALRKSGTDPHHEIPELSRRMTKLLAEKSSTESTELKYRLYEPQADGAAR